MNIFFQTEGLYLRNLESSDLDTVFAYRNDCSCAAYQRWEDTSREAIAAFLIQFSQSRFLSEQEEQHYAVCTKEHILVGDLSWFYNREDRCITLGITVAPEYQRRGIAREILSGVVDEIRLHYPQLDVVALIHPKNKASLCLFERLGFVPEVYADSIESWVYVMYADSCV